MSKLRNTCSRSLWLHATDGSVVGHVNHQADSAPAQSVLQDCRCRIDGAPHLRVAGSSCRTSRKRQHPAKNPAAHLQRLLELLEVLGEHGRLKPSAPEIFLQLLHERQHGTERIVHVVRHAACQIGHCVLSLSYDNAAAKRLGTMQIVDGDGSLGAEVLDQVRIVWFELSGMAAGDLQQPDQAVTSHQWRAQD